MLQQTDLLCIVMPYIPKLQIVVIWSILCTRFVNSYIFVFVSHWYVASFCPVEVLITEHFISVAAATH